MLPSQLTAHSFDSYPAQARALAILNLSLIQGMPLAFAALITREIRGYDWKFPAERRGIDDQLAFLQSLPDAERDRLLQGFALLPSNFELASSDWIANPQPLLDGLTSYLWATHKHDAFRSAAENYANAWHKAKPEAVPPMPRLGIVVMDADLRSESFPLFRKLRPHGVFFSQVNSDGGWQAIRDTLSARLNKAESAYQHWYIDGDSASLIADSRVSAAGYTDLQGTRAAILERMQTLLNSTKGGPEAMRTMMAETTPSDVKMREDHDEVLRRFKVSVLTEGSGTQIFSTTFVQWTAREALRRAQPSTIVLRFTPRQSQLPMNELLAGATEHNRSDPAGSLVDADMGAYYTWINLQRLTGAERSSFLVWSEAHRQAVAIGPTLPRATTATSAITVRQLLANLT
jgi:hypothetical protein